MRDPTRRSHLMTGGAKEKQAGEVERVRGKMESSPGQDAIFSPPQGWKAMTLRACCIYRYDTFDVASAHEHASTVYASRFSLLL